MDPAENGQVQEQIPFLDKFDEDEAEKEILLSKPTCFIIIGKPSIGKFTLAKRLSQTWKCVLINATELIKQHIAIKTEHGLKFMELLNQGLSIHEELVIKIILDKINSPEVEHHGYVLCSLPSMSEEYLKISEQMELIKNLKLKPDFIINIKCPDYDLCNRLSGQRQHPETGQLYQKEQWDPEKVEKKKKKQTGEMEEAEEEEEEEEEQEAEESELQKENVAQFVKRPEDFLENSERNIALYKDTLLIPLEDYMTDHDPQYLIELDGNMSPNELFMSVISRLESMGLRSVAVAVRLLESEEEEIDTDELLRTLSTSNMVAPRYRWRRSRWGRACPVALKQGHIIMGKPNFSVGFLDKIYVLSTQEALDKFMSNPRPYLLLPMPRPPCKVVVVGPPSSGKTTLCNLIAEKYGAKVVDMEKLIQTLLTEEREKSLKKVTEMTLPVALEQAMENHEQQVINGLTANADGVSTIPDEQQGNTKSVSSSEKSFKQSLPATTPTPPPTDEVIKNEMQLPITFSVEAYIDTLEKAIHQTSEERGTEVPIGGGWVLDNFPKSKAQLILMQERGLMPDCLICLRDSEDDGKYLLRRLYLLNQDQINSAILERLKEERTVRVHEAKERQQTKLEALRESELRTEEDKQGKLEAVEELSEEQDIKEQSQSETDDNQSQTDADSSQLETQPEVEPQAKTEVEPKAKSEVETDLEDEPEITLPPISEDGYPEVTEMEKYKLQVKNFILEWQTMESILAGTSSVMPTLLEIAGKTPLTLLSDAVTKIEMSVKYKAWEMTGVDLDEEEEDAQAAAEAEEQNVEEEEEEEEEEGKDEAEKESPSQRNMGDSKHFCPVTLKEKNILFPCTDEYAAKYKEKVYYFSSSEARETFLLNPEMYVAKTEPLKAPPVRVFLLGAHGSGKTTHGKWLANKLSIFHIQFKEWLQERIMFKTQKKIRPTDEEEQAIDEEEEVPQDLLDMLAARGLELPAELKSEEKQEETPAEVELNDEEEAIRSYLSDNEALPPEVLDMIVPKWWEEEPFRSIGFILEGFPQNPEEVQYLVERSLFPDTFVIMELAVTDIIHRLLPPVLSKWQNKRNKKLEKQRIIKELKNKLREEAIVKRRAELLAEQAEKKVKKDREEDSEEEEEVEEEEEEYDIESALLDEFPPEEDEDDAEEEQEGEAIERLESEIGERFQSDTSSLQSVQELLLENHIPKITVRAERMSHIVCFQLFEKLKPLVENREAIFEKCYPLSFSLARKLLHSSYKITSGFGCWDPVKLSEGAVIQPIQGPQNPSYPVIYRQFIYFFASKQNRDKFIMHPIKYLRQPKPKPMVPIKVAVVGPPKSGKSTVAKMFARVHGLQRLSIGEAIRSLLSNQKQRELTIQIKKYLTQGLAVPDELAVQCLDLALMDLACQTRGFVLDGFPNTKKQVDLLEARCIIPVRIFELQMETQEVLKRGLIDKINNERPYPLHDSPQILAIRNSCYKSEILGVKKYYEEQFQNWVVIDGERSKWWVWNKVLEEASTSVKHIQTYLERIREGKSASIDRLCITPQELLSRLGEFGQYCPVSLALDKKLVDCSLSTSLEYTAEFRGHYYKMKSGEYLQKFLDTPEMFVLPLAPNPLPPPHLLPKKLTAAAVKAKFPKQAEMLGYCPVTYLDGKQRYEALVPGNIEHAAEYRDKIYIFASEEKLETFLRLPETYWNQKLPKKLPPKKEPVLLTSLPMLGYLEQGTATSIINALTAVGCLKPKYPFLSVTKSALLYLGYHLKAYNPRNSDYVRKKYKKKLEQFEECCELVSYLGSKMTHKYKEPQERPIDFDHKLHTFLSLKGIEPTSTWVV
ncbi:adenylate kinase 9 [Acipenser oxyrinchus oxyrinchus]|uniref:Adenylate kinase 9 n=1 Tax=Acipenser oxyrinchus oxyrinchus TaxID=40147 RepID=A0AAD8GC79_ACIOX|nr:adenylate kinase 9 [Acipenser oxyrinchus oxyrinchus]